MRKYVDIYDFVSEIPYVVTEANWRGQMVDAYEMWQAICKMATERKEADVVPTKALRLFIDWADECGFGYDNIPDEYEKYKGDIEDMGWIEGLMYIVLKEAEENA